MKHILIAASGSIAATFIEWIERKRVPEIYYTIVTIDDEILSFDLDNHIKIIEADPTSLARIRRIMHIDSFTQAFIVVDDAQDMHYILHNIRSVDKKLLVVVYNAWKDLIFDDEHRYTVMIDMHDLMASHLFNHLPDVPLLAQNVGLGKGEIMEILVPFGSAFAYRHIASIPQRNWRVAALYRDDELILPSSSLMLKPNDSFLAVGNPIVLDGVYRSVNKRIGLFPEPYGKELYMLLDFESGASDSLLQLTSQAIFLVDRLSKKKLFIRIVNPTNFALLEKVRSYESERVSVMVDYDESIYEVAKRDLYELDIGLVMTSQESYNDEDLQKLFCAQKKLIFLFGKFPVCNLKECIVLMEEEESLEGISMAAFDVAMGLELKLCLCNYSPEGDFDSKKLVIEHYETLAQIFNQEITIESKVTNPYRELAKQKDFLLIKSYGRKEEESFFPFVEHIKELFLKEKEYPRLLVPLT